jgi:hypothetical protein
VKSVVYYITNRFVIYTDHLPVLGLGQVEHVALVENAHKILVRNILGKGSTLWQKTK